MKRSDAQMRSVLGFKEIFLGLVFVAMVGISFITFQQIVQFHTLSIIQKSPIYRVLFFAQHELINKLEQIPYRKNAEFIQSSQPDSAVFQASFDDEEAFKLCFDKDGNTLPTVEDPLCEIKLNYYRVHEVDRIFEGEDKIEGTSFNYIPASRLFMRARYPDKTTGDEKVLYFSRLKSDLLQF